MSHSIEFVAKEKNAPNCPQARPHEQFWAICKERYGKRKQKAKDFISFKKIWSNLSQEMAAEELGASLMGSLRSRLRQIGREGVYALTE